MENGQNLGKMSLGDTIRRLFDEEVTSDKLLVGHRTEAGALIKVGEAHFRVTITVDIEEEEVEEID